MIKLSKQKEVICKYSIEYLFHEFLKKFYRTSNFLTLLGNWFCLFHSNADTLFLQIKIQQQIYYWRERRIQNQI